MEFSDQLRILKFKVVLWLVFGLKKKLDLISARILDGGDQRRGKARAKVAKGKWKDSKVWSSLGEVIRVRGRQESRR